MNRSYILSGILGAIAVASVCGTTSLSAREAEGVSSVADNVTAGAIEGALPCEILRARILARAIDPVGSADLDEQQRTVEDVRMASAEQGARPGETCAATILLEMSRAPSCGSAASLITSAAARMGTLDPATLSASLESRSICARAVLSGAASLPSAEAQTVRALLRWAGRQRDPADRAGGLVVAGSLAHVARRNGDDTTADLIDRIIARELRKRLPGVAHARLLEAAGNAGCSACSGFALHALTSPSVEARLSALAALRFVPTAQAAPGMCAELLDDPMTEVREQAAWALRWDRSGIHERVTCLITSAARDPSGRVREMATASLGALGRNEPFARSALLHLTSAEYDPNVRAVAQHSLDAAGTDVEWPIEGALKF